MASSYWRQEQGEVINGAHSVGVFWKEADAQMFVDLMNELDTKFIEKVMTDE